MLVDVVGAGAFCCGAAWKSDFSIRADAANGVTGSSCCAPAGRAVNIASTSVEPTTNSLVNRTTPPSTERATNSLRRKMGERQAQCTDIELGSGGAGGHIDEARERRILARRD